MIVARSKVTSQGQISIPAEVRKDLAIKPGTELIWDRQENGEYVVRPKRRSLAELPDILEPFPKVEMTDGELREARRKFLETRWNRVKPE